MELSSGPVYIGTLDAHPSDLWTDEMVQFIFFANVLPGIAFSLDLIASFTGSNVVARY